MSLEHINFERLELVMLNGAIGANDIVIDDDGPLLAKEALLEAPEASRERVAVTLKLTLPQMIRRLKECAWITNKETSEERPMAMEIIEQVEAEVLDAIAQLWPGFGRQTKSG